MPLLSIILLALFGGISVAGLIAPQQTGEALGTASAVILERWLKVIYNFVRSMCITFGHSIVTSLTNTDVSDDRAGWIGFIAILEISYWFTRALSPSIKITPTGIYGTVEPMGAKVRYEITEPPRRAGRTVRERVREAPREVPAERIIERETVIIRQEVPREVSRERTQRERAEEMGIWIPQTR